MWIKLEEAADGKLGEVQQGVIRCKLGGKAREGRQMVCVWNEGGCEDG